MLHPDTLQWIDDLILTRDIVTAGDRTDFYDRARRGEFLALRRGAYVSTALWRDMDPDARYRARIRAVVAFANRDLVVSHDSAAVLWKLPWLGSWPRETHILSSVATGGRSTAPVVRHAPGPRVVAERIEGVAVTTLARTVADVASGQSFAQGVSVADAALRRTLHPAGGVPRTALVRDDLTVAFGDVPLTHGRARAKRAIEFADGAAASVGESVSRVNIHLAHLEAPRLQAPLRGASGMLWHVDFWWEQFNVIGEFDGKSKYTDERYLNGRTPAQAVYDEKLREDDLRAAGHGMTRWPWGVALSMPALRSHLVRAGIR